MADLNIQKVNEVYLQVKTEPHIEYELRDRFTFEVPNKKFMPQYRSKYWDGYVHLFNMKTKRIYVGLLDKVVAFCESSGYTYEFVDNPIAIDLLCGSSEARVGLETRVRPVELLESWKGALDDFREVRAEYLLY